MLQQVLEGEDLQELVADTENGKHLRQHGHKAEFKEGLQGCCERWRHDE